MILRRAVLLGTVLAAAAAAPAQAFYGNGATIVSASLERQEQGDDATVYGAISADGRYAVIETRARNFFADEDPDPPGRYRVGGIFRRDLDGGAMEIVAGGDQRRESDNELVLRGASNPSISGNGRYVAFSTAEKLVAVDVNDNVDVYVRDMAIPKGRPGSFTLVSARDGTDAPAAYAPRPDPLPGRNPGSEAFPGVALSADGRRVAFRTVAASDLPARASTDTPGLQVFVRDLDTRATTLVTRKAVDGAPAGGAAGPAGISGDGTTVAWTGSNAAEQTRFLIGEFVDPSAVYYLWQRVTEGTSAPTRRITGYADPDDPACPPGGGVGSNPGATGPCYGPLTDTEQARAPISNLAPAMSADGNTVAFVTAAGLRPTREPGAARDVFVTDMRSGVSRKAGTIEVTREGDPGDPRQSTPVDGVAISADGRRLAFATVRTSFILPSFRFLGARRSQLEWRDVYVVDVLDRTVERVSRAADSADTNGDAARDVSLSRDGARVLFTSTASNLFFGDSNERSDAFMVARQPEPVAEPPPPEPPPTLPPVIENPPEPPQLRLRARSQADGSVILELTVPGPGRIAAEAKAALSTRSSKKAKGKKQKPKKRQQTIARRSATARVAGRTRLRLKPASRFGADVRGRGGVRALATVTYTPTPAGRRLFGRVRVAFAVKPKKRKPAKGGKREKNASVGIGMEVKER